MANEGWTIWNVVLAAMMHERAIKIYSSDKCLENLIDVEIAELYYVRAARLEFWETAHEQ